MTSPSKALDSAVASINNFMTSKKKNDNLTYDSGRAMPAVIKVTKPKMYPYAASKMPKGTVFGAY